jgi:hypothetical protein
MAIVYTELYRSKPTKTDDDTLQITIVYEVSGQTYTGADGISDMPVLGTLITAAPTAGITAPVAGWTSSAFTVPAIAEVDLQPHYRATFNLMKVTYVGSRKWA